MTLLLLQGGTWTHRARPEDRAWVWGAVPFIFLGPRFTWPIWNLAGLTCCPASTTKQELRSRQDLWGRRPGTPELLEGGVECACSTHTR